MRDDLYVVFKPSRSVVSIVQSSPPTGENCFLAPRFTDQSSLNWKQSYFIQHGRVEGREEDCALTGWGRMKWGWILIKGGRKLEEGTDL